jgi:hypothetical protein
LQQVRKEGACWTLCFKSTLKNTAMVRNNQVKSDEITVQLSEKFFAERNIIIIKNNNRSTEI